jgi:F0F1-type ATP synthase assembly protein I
MPFNRPISNSKPRSKVQSGVETLVQAEKLMQIALMLPSAVAIGWILGAWGDSHFHQSWMTVAGVVLGAISGLSFVIRMAIAAERETPIDKESGSEKGKESSDRGE